MSSVAMPGPAAEAISSRVASCFQPSSTSATSSTCVSIGRWPPSSPMLKTGNYRPVQSPSSSLTRDHAKRCRRNEPECSNFRKLRCNCSRCTESVARSTSSRNTYDSFILLKYQGAERRDYFNVRTPNSIYYLLILPE